MSDLPDGFVVEKVGPVSGSTPPSSGSDMPPGFVLESTGKGGKADAPKPGVMDYVADVGKAIPSGLAKGAAGLLGLPGDLASGAEGVARWAQRKITGMTPEQQEASLRRTALGYGLKDTVPSVGSQNIVGGIESVTGPLYKPQTLPGQYAGTIAEFAPGALLGGGSAAARAAQVVAPAVASETAGQITKGTDYEPIARAAGGVLGGVGTALAQRAPAAERMLARSVEGVDPAAIKQAEGLMQRAEQAGVPLTWDEAIAKVTNGATGHLTNTRRVVENTDGGAQVLNPMMAQRAGQIAEAGERELGALSPTKLDPVRGAVRAQDAARTAIAETPEGVALSERLALNAPRTTADDAGAIIQPELRKIYEQREGMRAALADKDYAAARNAPANVPLDGGFGFRDVTKHRDTPGPGIYLDPAERKAATEAWFARNNQTERMPVLGLDPTKFGQADATSVLKHIDTELETAKGAVKQGLTAAKQALFTPAGELDASISGLHASRTAITDLISQAKAAGANNTVRELEGALGQLDNALEAVPAYGQASRSFKAASEPLKPFGDGRAPGNIVAKDQFNDDFVMPREAAPRAIEAGPSAARDFKAVASEPAHSAFENYYASKLVDGATDGRGNLNLDQLAATMREQEDMLRQFPNVRDRLHDIARARLNLTPVERSPLGRVAAQDAIEGQGQALLPNAPVAGSEKGAADAVRRIASKDPTAASNLIHSHLRTAFDEATQSLQSGANQFGGAKFAAVIRGNSQQAKNLQAVTEALPNGSERWAGLNNFLDILEATGAAPRQGSTTAFNTEIRKELGKGGLTQDAAHLASSAGTAWFKKAGAWWDEFNAGKNSEQIARILTNPASGRLLERLASLPPGGQQARVLAMRLAYMGRAGKNSATDKAD